MVFRMANLKLMTEEEREAYFNRPESLKVKIRLWSNFDVPEISLILGHNYIVFVFRKESPILEAIVTSPMPKAL